MNAQARFIEAQRRALAAVELLRKRFDRPDTPPADRAFLIENLMDLRTALAVMKSENERKERMLRDSADRARAR